MWTLDGLVGTETLDEIMNVYYNRWKFRHPNGNNFIEIVNEIVTKRHGDKFGENMNWFFDQVLKSTTICDYAIMGIKNNKNEEEKETDLKNNYNTEFTVNRIEDMVLPVEILVQFENGETLIEYWDGISQTKTYTYQNTSKIISVQLDPNKKLMLDVDSTNDSMTIRPSNVPTNLFLNKFMNWMQTLMQVMLVLA